MIVTISAMGQTMTLKMKSGSYVTYSTEEVEEVTFAEKLDESNPSGNYYNGHEYVDLGLPSGKLWATCNIGATSPEMIGDYFAWGETNTKEEYSKDTYNHYGKNIGENISGTEYDAAHVQWGGEWCMPTYSEFSEMTAKCTWKVSFINGNKCFVGTAPNGNSITIPACGWINVYNNNSAEDGAYWCSNSSGTYSASMVWLIDPTGIYCSHPNRKELGQCIRAIYRK